MDSDLERKKLEIAVDDARIVDLFFERSEDAIRLLGAKYGKYGKNIAMNILGNESDSDECLNDAYLGVWNSIPPTRPGNLRVFFGKVTRNRALNKYKALHAEKRGGDEVALSLEELYECEIARTEESEDQMASEEKYVGLGKIISCFLRTQKEEPRRIFVCRYYYFDSLEKIAERFGISVPKVKSSLHRTREKLRGYLEKEGVKI